MNLSDFTSVTETWTAAVAPGFVDTVSAVHTPGTYTNYSLTSSLSLVTETAQDVTEEIDPSSVQTNLFSVTTDVVHSVDANQAFSVAFGGT